jgi:hypothetical protein
VVGNNGYAGATGCEALSDFAQVSDHGIPSVRNGQRFRAEGPGFALNKAGRGKTQRQRAWKFFPKYRLRIGSPDFATLSLTN